MRRAYLHIGNGETLPVREIIGIFDMDTAGMAPRTKEFLRRAERAGAVSYNNTDIPRSFLLCGGAGRPRGLRRGNSVGAARVGAYRLKLSRISPAGLKERLSEDDQ